MESKMPKNGTPPQPRTVPLNNVLLRDYEHFFWTPVGHSEMVVFRSANMACSIIELLKLKSVLKVDISLLWSNPFCYWKKGLAFQSKDLKRRPDVIIFKYSLTFSFHSTSQKTRFFFLLSFSLVSLYSSLVLSQRSWSVPWNKKILAGTQDWCAR